MTLEQVNCDLCNGQEFYPFLTNEDWSYVECRCGLIYQNPRPTLDSIKEIYDKSYFDYEINNQSAFFNLMKLGLRDINFEALTKGLGNPKRFLDIGSATGLLLNYVKQQGWNCTGVEICHESADYARKNFQLDIRTKALEDCHFEDHFFDVIHFSHLIEHVPSPSQFLSEVYRILKPNGYIVVTTPNVKGLFAGIYKETWRSAMTQHLYLFSKKSLAQLLRQKGFKILKQVSWGGIPVEKSNGLVKKLTDKWVKRLNIGDVMLFLATKA